jgi:hypothetical protein
MGKVARRSGTKIALRAPDCICGKRMLQAANEGTCLWCGYGPAKVVVEFAYNRNMEGNVVSAVAPPPIEVREERLRVGRPLVPISAARRWTWDLDDCARAAQAEEARTGHFPRAADWQKAKGRGEHRPSYGTVIERAGSWSAFKRYCADIPRESVAA